MESKEFLESWENSSFYIVEGSVQNYILVRKVILSITCCRYKHIAENRVHRRVSGAKIWFRTCSAIVELMLASRADRNDENLNPESSSYDGLSVAANVTLRTWEKLRSGVQKLLLGIQQSNLDSDQLMDGLGRRGGVCELRVHVDNSLDVEH
ncbi:hypothetical protein SCA6_002793 [Theobroma cacao]